MEKVKYFYSVLKIRFLFPNLSFLESLNRPTQPLFNAKDCLYQFRSVAHRELCLLARERKRKKNETIITTDLPNYYLAQLPCGSGNQGVHWTRRNKHICSNKNDMCLTVSFNIKDGGEIVNLMAYEETAKSQQWMIRAATGSRTAVALVNVGTSLCLFDPTDEIKMNRANTVVKGCPQPRWFAEYLFYFEQAKSKDRKNCPSL